MTLTAEQLTTWIGEPVYSSDDKEIGEVGGFLGVGETSVRLMPVQITLQADRVLLNVTAA